MRHEWTPCAVGSVRKWRNNQSPHCVEQCWRLPPMGCARAARRSRHTCLRCGDALLARSARQIVLPGVSDDMAWKGSWTALRSASIHGEKDSYATWEVTGLGLRPRARHRIQNSQP